MPIKGCIRVLHCVQYLVIIRYLLKSCFIRRVQICLSTVRVVLISLSTSEKCKRADNRVLMKGQTLSSTVEQTVQGPYMNDNKVRYYHMFYNVYNVL